MTDREIFLKKFNNAFVENDLNFIFDSVTNDVHWEMIGEPVITGKEALIEAMNKVKRSKEMTLHINSMLITEDVAAVDGSMTMKDSDDVEKKYMFCDLYKFSSSEENKIKEVRAFIIDVTNINGEKIKS